jgi:hypothetical protein
MIGSGVRAGRSRSEKSKRGRYRRAAALYGLIFLFAVASAPHRHFNSLGDLLSDGPSDSGVFVESPAHVPEPGPCLNSSRLIDDDPCLACFHNDYAASPAAVILLPADSASLSLIGALPGPAIPEPLCESPASRSPPDRPRFS